jgi:hypothetical protein
MIYRCSIAIQWSGMWWRFNSCLQTIGPATDDITVGWFAENFAGDHSFGNHRTGFQDHSLGGLRKKMSKVCIYRLQRTDWANQPNGNIFLVNPSHMLSASFNLECFYGSCTTTPCWCGWNPELVKIILEPQFRPEIAMLGTCGKPPGFHILTSKHYSDHTNILIVWLILRIWGNDTVDVDDVLRMRMCRWYGWKHLQFLS